MVENASESELAEASARADRAGFFTCPHTGVTLAAIEKFAQRGAFGSSDRVVAISTAHGLKFGGVKADYHHDQLAGVQPQQPNQPKVLPASIDAVYEAVEQHRESMK